MTGEQPAPKAGIRAVIAGLAALIVPRGRSRADRAMDLVELLTRKRRTP